MENKFTTVRELIYERSQYGEGWTAWDGEHRDKIPGTNGLTQADFDVACDCAVKAWGETWKEAVEMPYDGSHTN